MSISTSTLRRAQRSFSRQLTKESTAPRFKTSVTEGVYQTPRFRPPDTCSKYAQSHQRVESNLRNLTSEFPRSSGAGGANFRSRLWQRVPQHAPIQMRN